jgi:predicted MPP superfamily phosphohydrolase
MDNLLALIDWRERITTGPFVASLIVLIIGECCLYSELSSRVLGTYVRTLPRIVMRNIIVWLACAVLAVPYLLALTQAGDWAAFWLLLSSLLNLLIILHFLFPYRFGIRTLHPKAGVMAQQRLTRGVVLRRVTVEEKLPAASPISLRCLVLSDLHCTWRLNVKRLRAALAALPDVKYDMVFVLGDLGENSTLLPEVMRAIADLRPKHGVFCVRGNHDFERDRAELIAGLARENAMILLANASYVVPGLGIEIVGLEWPWDRGVLPSPSQAAFAIGLTHTPDNIKIFNGLSVPLALAGHTHAGKITLPWIGSFPIGSKYGRFLDEGWFQFGNTRLYITSGLRHFPGLLGKPGVLVELVITDPTGPAAHQAACTRATAGNAATRPRRYAPARGDSPVI